MQYLEKLEICLHRTHFGHYEARYLDNNENLDKCSLLEALHIECFQAFSCFLLSRRIIVFNND